MKEHKFKEVQNRREKEIVKQKKEKQEQDDMRKQKITDIKRGDRQYQSELNNRIKDRFR